MHFVGGVFVPFAAGGEQEQTMRATRLEQAGLAICLAQQDLSASRLAQAVDAACKLDRSKGADLHLDGAANTAAILSKSHEAFIHARST